MRQINLIILTLLLVVHGQAQMGYSPLIDSLIQQTNDSTLSLLNRQLSGDTSVIIDGGPYTIATRYYSSEGNEMAAQWIYEQFENLGYDPEFQVFSTTGVNVLATKPGTQFTSSYFIICGHYDDMPSGSIAPGADDNASGVCAVLEAARLLKNQDIPYTLKFIAFDNEEIGLIGSSHYASEAASQGDDILGVINLDMIAWDSDSDYEYSIATNENSIPLKDDFVTAQMLYQPHMNHNIISTTASDHAPFWYNGYQALLAIEDWNDFNNYYHTPGDQFDILNVPFFTSMVRSSIATLASLAWDFKMDIEHDPLLSSNTTNDRIATATITSSHPIGQGGKIPRLFYQIENGAFDFVLPSNINGNTYEFIIPGQPIGTLVSYYIASQDDASLFVTTLPAGGRGLDPPGTIPPAELFSYYVADIQNLTSCSETTPQPIYDLQLLYDTLQVNETGYLLDLNVMVDVLHSYDGDIEIGLIGPNNQEITLSAYNGGSGNHYSNTVFDDQATTSITEGLPPFEGNFIPEEPLATFQNQQVEGNWILKIYDSNQGDQGNLLDWCVNMQYSTELVSTDENAITSSVMMQCYPNPVYSSATIEYTIHQPGHVSIQIYDIYGRKIRILTNKYHQTGKYLIRYNVNQLPAGQYFYRLHTGEGVQVESFTVLK